MKKKRYTSIDAIRGLLIISMIAFHTAWDLVYIFGVKWPWYGTYGAFVWQQSIAWGFILLSGFCWHMGRRKLRRALLVLASSVLITAVTLIVMPENRIVFGVLTLIGFGMLTVTMADKALSKINPFLGAGIFALLFAFFRNIESGSLGLFGRVLVRIPKSFYKNHFTAFFGLPHNDFFSTDYVPILPWIFLFITGYYIYAAFGRMKMEKLYSSVGCAPLEFLGRHSLVIYLAHQPIVYGVLYLVFNLL